MNKSLLYGCRKNYLTLFEGLLPSRNAVCLRLTQSSLAYLTNEIALRQISEFMSPNDVEFEMNAMNL